MRIKFFCLARKIRLGLLSSIVTAATVLGCPAHAQQRDVKPAYVATMHFDVASIRQSPTADSYMVGSSFAPQSSSFTATNLDVMNLLTRAYDIHSYRIIGLPPWRAMFNVQAKADSETDKHLALLTVDQQQKEQRHMLQALLADRFRLRMHWETRDGPAYQLIALKNRRGLSVSASLQLTPEEKLAFGNRPVPPIYQQGSSMTSFSFIAHACTITNLSEMLAAQFGHPVLDKTGYTGKYDFTLNYKGIRVADRDPDDMESVPTLDVALQEQLGLKLEAMKTAEDVLVIDHIEIPSEN